MTVAYIRVLFVLFAAVIGYQIGPLFAGGASSGIIGAMAGAGLAAVVIWIEASTARVSLRGLSAAVFGLLLAFLVYRLVSSAIDLIGLDAGLAAAVKLIIVLILCYLGMVLGMRGRDEFNIIIPYIKFQRQKQSDAMIILDTSVIIDGRVADMAHTKFVDGHYVVPKFILKELQKIADSPDPIRRSKGRRGLDVLSKLRKDPKINLKIHEEDFTDIPEVDSKLIKLARVLDARIMTNDYNLNRAAELQDVDILNINELATALRPVVLPGERLEVTLSKEGKEPDQAVAYLGDGTMVVVERARKLIGTTLFVVVTSVLQTAAGRMVFAKLENEAS